MEGIPVCAAIVATALVLCTTASANALTCAHGSNCNSTNPQGNPPSWNGTLPFTGVDLTGVAAIPALLLGSGVALQRVSRGPR